MIHVECLNLTDFQDQKRENLVSSSLRSQTYLNLRYLILTILYLISERLKPRESISTTDISQNTNKVHTCSSARMMQSVLIRHLQMIKHSFERYLFTQIICQRRIYSLIAHDRLVTFWLINNKSRRWEPCAIETIFYYIIL